MRLLIIDDEPHILRALTLLFEPAGYEVLVAHNGLRGLEKLLAERPDFAGIDVMMPGMNGMEVLRAWDRQKQATDTTHFIMLTASCDAEIQSFAQQYANLRLVAKPFSPKKILSMVQEATAANTITQNSV